MSRNYRIAGLAGVLLAAACASTPKPPLPSLALPSFSVAKLLGFDKSQEQIAWEDLLRNSEVKQVSLDQFIVEAWGAPATDMEDVELRLLARTAAEAQRLGYERFAFVHIRDRNMPITGGLFSSSIYGFDRVWIGRYNQLVESRYERDYAVAPRAWVNPGLTAIVQMVEPDHRRFEDSFQVEGLYQLLNGSEMAGK